MQRLRSLAIALLGASWVVHVVGTDLRTISTGDRWLMLAASCGILAAPLLVFAGWESRRLTAAYEADVHELAERRAAELAAAMETERSRARIADVLSADGGLIMHFQPIIDLTSGRTTGHEALARFPHGSPHEWFAEARRVGFGVDLEVSAIRQARTAIGALDGYISVNVSPATILDGRFWQVIDGVEGSRLVIELTEHVLVEEYDRYEPALLELRRRGIRIAIDDAGAGHSSMRHIVHMAPEIIKLDRSLISMIDIDPIKRSLVTALRGFAVAIDATLVAEGIERTEEADAMTAMGVACGQGWLFSRAIPMEEARQAQVVDLRSAEPALP